MESVVVGGVKYQFARFATQAHARLVVNAGQPGAASLLIDDDADFEIQALSYFADLAGAAQTDSGRVVPLITVQISDGQSQRPLLGRVPPPLPTVAGHQGLPFLLPERHIAVRRSTVDFAYQNFSAGSNYGLQLVLIGRKLFGGPRPSGV
jgi:hypothetical protein